MARVTRAAAHLPVEEVKLTGTRSTANTYQLDRFWRNAPTFSVHDATNLKLLIVGTFELTGKVPPFNPAQARI